MSIDLQSVRTQLSEKSEAVVSEYEQKGTYALSAGIGFVAMAVVGANLPLLSLAAAVASVASLVLARDYLVYAKNFKRLIDDVTSLIPQDESFGSLLSSLVSVGTGRISGPRFVFNGKEYGVGETLFLVLRNGKESVEKIFKETLCKDTLILGTSFYQSCCEVIKV